MAERRDTRRNRAALTCAAREVLIARGMDAPVKSIARAAGLGTATLYRHFPTRAELVTAVFGDEIDSCRAKLDRARTIPDSWEALRHLLRTVADTELSVPGLAGSLSQAGVTVPAYDALWVEAQEVVGLLAARIREEGARPDLQGTDLWLLLEAVRSATTTGRRSGKYDAERLITLLVDGLRPS